MIIAETMNKSVVKVSVSDSESSEAEDSEDGGTVEVEAKVTNSKVDSVDAGSDADNSSQSDSNDEDHNQTETGLTTNQGWADSLAKILGSSKPKNKKTLVLSRAKKHSETVKSENEKKPDFEVIGKEEKIDASSNPTDTSEPVSKKKKIEKPSIRVKPDILEKNREKILSKIATKGVVQLFNAVRNQQKTIEKQTDRKDLTETKKDKILKKFDKRTFLDTLMGNTKSVIVDEAKVKKDKDAPKWKVLRDDYMMDAKMKDWDKEVNE